MSSHAREVCYILHHLMLLTYKHTHTHTHTYTHTYALAVKAYTHLSILNGVTISGKVRFWAMVRGTPTWSISRLGSGVMTARAEKSTLFPMRFPLTRPSLLFRRCLMDFKGRPLRWTAWMTEQQWRSLYSGPFSINCIL